MSDARDYEVKEELQRIRNTGIFVNSPDRKGLYPAGWSDGPPLSGQHGQCVFFIHG